MFFIVYDSTGIPIDTHEVLFWIIIRPKLAKRYDITQHWGFINVNTNEKVKIRVLDFEIIK